MILTCVRHGQTAWNAEGRFQGHTDVPLDAIGREQAAVAGRRLSSVRFDIAVASDLVRAAETARIILEGRELALDLDPRWREMSFGAWEGLTWAQIEERYPQPADAPTFTPRTAMAPGGESFDDLCERISTAFEAIRERASADASVLIVAHAGPLHALLRVLGLAGGDGALSVKFLPASVSRFAEREGKWEIRGLNTVDGPIDEAGVLPAGP